MSAPRRAGRGPEAGRGHAGPGLVAGLVGLGVGLAAAGAGAAIGLAAERVSVGRLTRIDGDEDTDGRGGPALGSLRGEPHVVVSDGVPLHVEVDEPDPDMPAGLPTIVFSHGYALTLDSWHYQRLALRGRYRLVLWDQRGHGRSGTGPAGSSTIDQVGADLAAVIDQLAPEEPLVLLGHSMGGMTVMSLAALRPELFAERVAGVAMLATSAGGEGEAAFGLARFGGLAARLAPVAVRTLARQPGLVARGRRLGSDLEGLLVRRYSYASPVPPQLVAFSARMIASTRVEVISDFLPGFGNHDKRAALAAMTGLEVLVMVGDHDLLTPEENSERIVGLLPAAEHVVLEHAGHLLMLEHPDAVNAHLSGLLERVARKRAVATRPGRRRGGGRRTVGPGRGWRRRAAGLRQGDGSEEGQ